MRRILEVLFSKNMFLYGDYFCVIIPDCGGHAPLVTDKGTTLFRLNGRKIEMRHDEWPEEIWQETSCLTRATIRERLAILWRAFRFY